ncbi:MAG: outer membrane beta-barrel protein [Bacteroidales bacterium]|nr:outer membrane beta-barrel protein [Bacteroidales bacterium]MCF8403122.1 outer membrane beta-barrel protein [Bacteroidales bacterium]
MVIRKIFTLLVCVGCVFMVRFSQAQSSLNNEWYLNLNAGLAQMFGDLETESNHLTKLKDETDLGLGIRAGKYLSPVFTSHLQISRLAFKGLKKANNIGFNTTLMEIQLGATANLTNLFFGQKERLLNIYGLAGVNGMLIRSEAYSLLTGEIVNDVGYTTNGERVKSSPEFAIAFPLGAGLDIKVADHWFINLETGLRIGTSDILDGYERGSNYDAYYYTSLGLSYNFSIAKNSRFPEPPPALAEKPANPLDNEIVDFQYFFPKDLNSLDEFTMKCRVVKGKIDGKAELTQILPIGFNVTDTLISNARTEFKNYTLSLYWDEIPTDSVFEINYHVKLDKIFGSLPMTSILYFEKTGKEHKYKTEVFIKRKIIAEPIVVVEKKPTEKEMVSPSEKVEFRIQLRASYGAKLSIDSLAKLFHIDKPIKEEKIKGWYKYSVGSFKTYQEARDYRKQLLRSNKINDAFIVAFYDNKRLNTLSELKEIAPETLPGVQPPKPKFEEAGQCYRVQILALKEKSVSPSVLKDMYQLEEGVYEEVFHNFRKYTVGYCLTKQEALSLRIQLVNKGLTGAFLVAYKNGERSNL